MFLKLDSTTSQPEKNDFDSHPTWLERLVSSVILSRVLKLDSMITPSISRALMISSGKAYTPS